MSTAPRINYFDGSGTTTALVVTTNVFTFTFTGTLDSNTVDLQIDLNGAGFISDPSLVELVLPNFTVPNPLSYPNGLVLEKGLNTIRLRAIDLSGQTSPVSTITVTVVTDAVMQQILSPPTGTALQRNANSIDLVWSDATVGGATGFNVYASTGQGGTGSGYLRVNADLIPGGSPQATIVDEFIIGSVDYEFSDDPNLDLEIVVNTVDRISGQIVERKSQNIYSLVQSPDYAVSLKTNGQIRTNTYRFNHNRDANLDAGYLNNDVFGAVVPSDPLYYVVTAVYFDKGTGVLQESRYSAEMTGNPLALDTTIRGINIRDQRLITQDYITQVQKKAPTLALIPASTIREVHIEPFSNESQKIYFLMDFVHRSKSFAALLAIDDPGFTGTSVPVSTSSYKQNLKTALSTSDDAAVQSFIDAAFTSLAENFGIARQGSKLAQVVQTFYTKTKPTRDLIVQQGAIVNSSSVSGAPRFVAKGQTVMVAANALSYYNVDLKRYQIQIQMVADSPGAAGNVPAGALDQVVSGAVGLSTVNDVSATYGSDSESNLSLSENGQRALSSLDTGTSGGYRRVSELTDGVLNVEIVKSGDAMMMRDYDPVRMKHIGGKVDIWVKGTNERTIQETFAFQFDAAHNVRFDVVDALTLTFRARDSRLTPSNPIQEMLYNPSQNLGLRNFSNLPSTPYDLTGVTVVDYNTIRLSTLIPQPQTLLDDFVEGDYRFRSNNKFVGTVQPIRRVVSVVGEISGPLDSSLGYTLFKTEDPLLEGESTIATDYVSINQVGNVPNGDAILVNDELHVMIGAFVEPLNFVGVNLFTLRVYSQDRQILYNGPDDANPDYLVVDGTPTKPAKIVRSTNSTILNGSTVSVDYEHDENFVVTYVVNAVLQTLQTQINLMKHVTADVLVKQAIENPLFIEATVQLAPNADQSKVDSGIRTAQTILTASKATGGSIHQSDEVAVMDPVAGVDFLVQPFTRMTLQDGALRLRDQILPENVFLPSLSRFNNAVYILTQELPFATIDGGGDPENVRGVYKDDIVMEMSKDLTEVGDGLNRSFIIGRLGAVIVGYSDDATLLPLFFTPQAVAAERLARTANRVVVSLDYGSDPRDLPDQHTFSATYQVSGDTGTRDIETSQVEYLTPGDLTLTYREARGN